MYSDLNQDTLDNLVFEIVRDHDGSRFSKTATRQDINDSVLDHFKKHVSEYVLPAIQRLVDSGRILPDRDTTAQGHPFHYYLPPEIE